MANPEGAGSGPRRPLRSKVSPGVERIMDTMLFTERSLLTMLHGMALGGGALMGLAIALFSLRAMRFSGVAGATTDRQALYLTWLLVATAALLWSSVLAGTYITFPAYRAAPPEGIADLGAYPKALIQSVPGTAWLHSFAMEAKEHVPWIAAMLATAVAFVGLRYRAKLLGDRQLNDMATVLVAICFGLVSFVALLGVLVNKVAPVE